MQLIGAGRLMLSPGAWVTDGAVLVSGERIVAAGPRAAVERSAPPSAIRHSFPGGTVLPGLIDAHVHLAMDASADPVAGLLAGDTGELARQAADRAARMLATGVTTVRDLGGHGNAAIQLRDAISAGRLPGPRILAAGTPLTPPGGHGWFFGGEVDGERAAIARVRSLKAAGADLVKVMASGGHITSGSVPMHRAQFTGRQLLSIVSEAHRLGMPVAAHAHGIERSRRPSRPRWTRSSTAPGWTPTAGLIAARTWPGWPPTAASPCARPPVAGTGAAC